MANRIIGWKVNGRRYTDELLTFSDAIDQAIPPGSADWDSGERSDTHGFSWRLADYGLAWKEAVSEKVFLTRFQAVNKVSLTNRVFFSRDSTDAGALQVFAGLLSFYLSWWLTAMLSWSSGLITAQTVVVMPRQVIINDWSCATKRSIKIFFDLEVRGITVLRGIGWGCIERSWAINGNGGWECTSRVEIGVEDQYWPGVSKLNNEPN